MGCLPSRPFKVFASVEYPRWFFLPTGSPKTSNKIRPSCLGESRLNSSPAKEMISALTSAISALVSAPMEASASVSSIAPTRSMPTSVPTNGRSISV